jgi:hypothetical protein
MTRIHNQRLPIQSGKPCKGQAHHQPEVSSVLTIRFFFPFPVATVNVSCTYIFYFLEAFIIVAK